MLLPVLLLLVVPPSARAALQFDVFFGYDGLVREANWFPVACEIHNDGPSFNGVVEIAADQFGSGQSRRVFLELPTSTRKRFVTTVFGAAGSSGAWNVRLLDEKGRVRAERMGIRPRRDLSWRATLVGALPRTFAGLPKMPDRGEGRVELSPEVARLQTDYFPDNPIALEGLDALYLHSERALSLGPQQQAAIVSWMLAGGHLIVNVDQPGDLNGAPWLKALLPAEPTGVSTLDRFSSLEDFAKQHAEAAAVARAERSRSGRSKSSKAQTAASLSGLPHYDQTAKVAEGPLPLLTVRMRDGRVLLSQDDLPLVIQAPRGRGRVTLLAINSERNPFLSWRNKGWFWARLTGVAPEFLTGMNVTRHAYQSVDGVFGAMVDSKQVRKLPVSWLLLLLFVYLMVIGPLDQYSLKKLNKQMLTWITFPAYVIGFSLLIYWIGFLLRAGETEWNELHIVDVIPRGAGAELRGRTFGSVYSPSNARYRFASEAAPGRRTYAAWRGEYMGNWGGRQDAGRGSIDQRGDGFEAEVFVPVWTSQLCVGDWMQSGEVPLTAAVNQDGDRLKITVDNKLARPLKHVHLVARDRVHDVGVIEAGSSKTVNVPSTGGQSLTDFLRNNAMQFSAAASQRRQAFGNNQQLFIGNVPPSIVAASFLSRFEETGDANDHTRDFISSRGLDLTGSLKAGQAVVFAWDEGKSLVPPLNQFTPKRSSIQTMIRLAVPVAGAN